MKYYYFATGDSEFPVLGTHRKLIEIVLEILCSYILIRNVKNRQIRITWITVYKNWLEIIRNVNEKKYIVSVLYDIYIYLRMRCRKKSSILYITYLIQLLNKIEL